MLSRAWLVDRAAVRTALEARKAPLKDIVERLRKSGTSLALEAADEIEKCRHALRLIANGQVTVTPCEPQEDDDGMAWPGHYGRA